MFEAMLRRAVANGVVAVGLLVVLAPRPVCAAADVDPWFGRDKALHFSASAVVAGGGYGVASLVTEDRRWRVLAGVGAGVAVGTGKELIDAAGAGDPSWRDFTWDLLGTATGVALSLAIDWLISR